MKFSLSNLFVVGAMAVSLYGQPVRAQEVSAPEAPNCIVIPERYTVKVPGPLSPEPALPQVYLETVQVVPQVAGEGCFYDFRVGSDFIRSYRQTELNCGVQGQVITCTGFTNTSQFIDMFALDYQYNVGGLPYPVLERIFGVDTLWFHLGNPIYISIVTKG